LTANLINEFFLPFSVKYKGVPFWCQYLHLTPSRPYRLSYQ
jgi:hypothetical protein